MLVKLFRRHLFKNYTSIMNGNIAHFSNYNPLHFKAVTHVIFDLDGLLIDTESQFKKILANIIAPLGKKHTDEVHNKLIGRPQPDIAQIAINEYHLPWTIDEFVQILRPKIHEEMINPSLMPGAKKLIEHLHQYKVPICIATSSTPSQFNRKTKNLGDFFKLFDHILCGGDNPLIKNGKPEPDIFLISAKQFPGKPQPSRCLVFEDSTVGVRGALNAGMQVIMVPDKFAPKEVGKEATLVLNSLNDFEPYLFGLPDYN